MDLSGLPEVGHGISVTLLSMTKDQKPFIDLELFEWGGGTKETSQSAGASTNIGHAHAKTGNDFGQIGSWLTLPQPNPVLSI